MIEQGTKLSKALALLVAGSPAIVLVAIFGLWASDRWEEDGERLVAAREQAHVLEATIRQTREYEPVRAVWREYAASDVAGLIRSATEEAADAIMRSRLSQTFERFDGVWIGAEALPPEEQNALTLLRLEARGEMPESAVAAFLEELEIDTPYVFVDAFDVRRIDSAPDAVDGAPTTLDVRLTVSAYWLAEEDDG